MLGGGKVCGIGMQVNTDGYGCMALDINHDILRHEWVDADMSGVEPDVVFGKLDAMAKAMAEDLESKRCIIAGVSCALPGLVTSDKRLLMARNLGWENVDLTTFDVMRGYDVTPCNEAKLAAIAQIPGYACARADVFDGVDCADSFLYLSCDIGIGGAMQHMLKITDGALETSGSMMLIICFVLGSIVGELLDIEGAFERFGAWLRKKTHNESDTGFLSAFIHASLTVCIGAMAIVGSIQDGILGDHATLFAKAVLDLVIILVMTASMGKGCIFSAIPVALLQGGVTLLSRVLAPVFTEAAIANLSYTGSVMIFCVGLNLVWGKKIKVANLLPTLVFAVLYALVF